MTSGCCRRNACKVYVRLVWRPESHTFSTGVKLGHSTIFKIEAASLMESSLSLLWIRIFWRRLAVWREVHKPHATEQCQGGPSTTHADQNHGQIDLVNVCRTKLQVAISAIFGRFAHVAPETHQSTSLKTSMGLTTLHSPRHGQG